MKAIVFFTFRPPKQIFDFAKTLKTSEYDIFVSVNDNNYALPEYDTNCITVIRMDSNEVRTAGYFNSNINIRGQVSSRDKAFFYFNRFNTTNYKHIWFIEEDVFIPTVHTISDIDAKYTEGDFMSNYYLTVCDDIHKYPNVNKEFKIVDYNPRFTFNESWAFVEARSHFSLPWFKGMTCAIRVSKLFLHHVDLFARKHHTLFFDEVLYYTLAMHNNLSIVTPIELTPITCNSKFADEEIRDDYLFHPIKDLDVQSKIRLSRAHSVTSGHG